MHNHASEQKSNKTCQIGTSMKEVVSCNDTNILPRVYILDGHDGVLYSALCFGWKHGISRPGRRSREQCGGPNLHSLSANSDLPNWRSWSVIYVYS